MVHQIKPHSWERPSDDSRLSAAGLGVAATKPALIVQFLDLARYLQHQPRCARFSIAQLQVPAAAQVTAAVAEFSAFRRALALEAVDIAQIGKQTTRPSD
jgi:hypothetical protein